MRLVKTWFSFIAAEIAFFSEPASDLPPDAAGFPLALVDPTEPAPVFVASGASLSVSFSSASSLSKPSWLSTSICVLGMLRCGEDQGQGLGEVAKRDMSLEGSPILEVLITEAASKAFWFFELPDHSCSVEESPLRVRS